MSVLPLTVGDIALQSKAVYMTKATLLNNGLLPSVNNSGSTQQVIAKPLISEPVVATGAQQPNSKLLSSTVEPPGQLLKPPGQLLKPPSPTLESFITQKNIISKITTSKKTKTDIKQLGKKGGTLEDQNQPPNEDVSKKTTILLQTAPAIHKIKRRNLNTKMNENQNTQKKNYSQWR